MRFKEVIGHEQVKQALVNNVNEGRISHAQLFLGEEGSGNLPMALAYAQYILCGNREMDDSCGKCAACQKVTKLVHPDLHFTFPFFSSKADKVSVCRDVLVQWRSAFTENPYLDTTAWYGALGADNKQGLINKEEGSDILHRLNLKSYEGGYKINILWMPETLHASAANALLKIIEEPPVQTLFLFAGSKVDEILPTILSRTQIVKINRLGVDELATALMKEHELEEAAAWSLAATSEGNYLEAVTQMRNQDHEALSFSYFTQWMRACYAKDVQKVIEWVEEIAKIGREKQKQFIHYCLFMARQCMLKHYLGEEKLSVRGQELAFIQKFSPFINENNILEFTRNCDEAYRDIVRNANPKILFMDLSFKAFVLIKK